MEENRKMNTGKIILIIVGILVAMFIGFLVGKKFYDKEPELDPTQENKDNKQKEIVDAEYPHTLDTHIEGDTSRRVYYENGKIVIIDFEKEQKVAVNDVVSLGLDCNCGFCGSVYYLNTNKELYEISLDHGTLLLDENNLLDSESVKKISDNVVGFKMIDTTTLDEEDTCGGYVPRYKTTAGEVHTLYYD